ncbi:replicative DNA helicase [Streptomyces sp. NPDC058625]|uniref:replicative DNA helicase n=1 Tax=Streptomyces sp. NPDC058625 TaxID=3346564 RepID=UPI0036624101
MRSYSEDTWRHLGVVRVGATRGKRGLVMPGEEQVPPGPHRQMLIALHRAYAAAGRPGLRQIALGLKLDDSAPATLNYQAVGKILNGKQLPNPRQLASLALWLSREGSVEGQTDEDSRDFLQQLLDLCEAAHRQHLGLDEDSDNAVEHDSGTGSAREAREEAAHPEERYVLGCMLRSKDALADVVEILRSDDFESQIHRKIYEALLGTYASSADLTIENVSVKLSDAGLLFSHTGVADYLYSLLTQAADLKKACEYAELVAARSKVRRISALGKKITSMAEAAGAEDDPDVDALMSLVESEVFSIVDDDSPVGGFSIEATLDEVEALGSGVPLVGVPSGFHDFDTLNAGLRPGELVIVGGASGMGKSTLALDFVRHCSIAHSRTSLLLSLQMSREEITMRMLSAEARVALHHMRSGSMTDDDWTRLARVMPSVTEAPVYMVDDLTYSLDDLVRACKRLHAFKELSLVVIDSIDLLKVDRPDGPSGHEPNYTAIAQELRKTARELGVPVVAFYQIGRLSERYSYQPPGITDIPGSLESVADIVILLHREDAYDKESPRAGEADLIIAKNRNGPTATVTVAFMGHYSRFVSMSGV